MVKIALGNSREATQPDCHKALAIEFVATFLFVFNGVGSAMAAGASGRSFLGLFGVAMTHAVVAAVMISVAHISGGHLNPAITLGHLVGGRITVFRSLLYMIVQLVASSAASLLLQYLTGGLVPPMHKLASGITYLQGFLWEMILSFSLQFTISATTVDPKVDPRGALGPILTGFVIGVNTLTGGAFTGGSMNPARSFGPALASWDWTDHWVYWVGPLIGGGLAGLVYDNFFIRGAHAVLPTAGEDC